MQENSPPILEFPFLRSVLLTLAAPLAFALMTINPRPFNFYLVDPLNDDDARLLKDPVDSSSFTRVAIPDVSPGNWTIRFISPTILDDTFVTSNVFVIGSTPVSSSAAPTTASVSASSSQSSLTECDQLAHVFFDSSRVFFSAIPLVPECYMPSKHMPVGAIVGIVLGATKLILLALLLLRARKLSRRRLIHTVEPGVSFSHPNFSTSSGKLPFGPSTSDSSIGRNVRQERQEHLLVQMGGAVQKQLDALNGEQEMRMLIQDGRMRSCGRGSRLEGQLQSQWALGLSDEPPPEYLES
ncbi:hypothetical protein C8R45DRAFT_1096327 [Mycena sanguinolenta]|nr:hypothetical protein C8R45DRAFT_1096327 [Mycena sanguinolenta]